MKTRNVEIRVRVLGRNGKKLAWKIYPPLVLDVNELTEKLGELAKKWAPKQGAFYTNSESDEFEQLPYSKKLEQLSGGNVRE